jgi:ribonuclease HII
MSTGRAPTLDLEREILGRGFTVLAAIDEVGRGAIAGPASVGIVLIRLDTANAPPGVRDSKLLSASQRRALVPTIEQWALESAVGHSSAQTVDDIGIMGALAVAAHNALAGLSLTPDVILLDGSHDWLSGPAHIPTVITRVKADLTCAGVGAASVLAKVQRDDIMIEMSTQYPQFAWASNKGYATATHLEAVRQFGPTSQHRRSWNLPQQIPRLFNEAK